MQGHTGQHPAHKSLPGVRLNEHLEHPRGRRRVPARLQDGPRRGRVEAARNALPVRPSPDWLKFKNPEAPAVKREAEEDWGR